MASRSVPAALHRLLDRVIKVPDDDFIIMNRRQLPRPPAKVDMRDVIADWGYHDHDHFRVDLVHLYARPLTLGRIGLLILADVLHPNERGVEIRFTNPRSVVKRWRFRSASDASGLGLVQQPIKYGYTPRRAERHPWSYERDAAALPHFALTNAEESTVRDEERAARDTLLGCGGANASARFASLLLDLARPGNECVEVELEGEAGFGSLAPASAELKIWLPGSVAWEYGDFDSL
jgi:hypothetical protein